jgi:Gpi18-like mannosyltransferase
MNSISLFKNKVRKRISELTTCSLLSLILFGLALRFLLAPFSSDPNDIQVFYTVTDNLLGGLNIYATNSFSYPPLWAYIEFPALRIASFFVTPELFGVRVDTLGLSNETWKLPQIITSPLFNILCKFPLIVADLLIGLIIYSIVKEQKDEKSARISFILWFLNPLVIGINAVQGQFDVLPTLMTVLSFCLFLRRNYFASGIAIGLGILFKIYPVFLVPLYLFSVAVMEIREVEITKKMKDAFAGYLKFIAGISIPFSLFLVPLINSNLVHNVFSRTQVIPSSGGLTPFSVILLLRLEWLFQFLVDNSIIVSLILTATCFIVALIIGFISFHGRKDFLKTFLFAHIAVILSIYMTSLTVNAQYALWVLPFLILSYGLYRNNYYKLNILSISALLFLIGLLGPSLFYPLSAYTPFISPQLILDSTYFFEHSVSWLVLSIGSILGVVTLILCLRGTIYALLRIRKNEQSNNLLQEKPKNNEFHLKLLSINPSKILTGFFIVLILGQFLAYTQPFINQTVSFDVLSLNTNRSSVGIDYGMKSGNYPTDVQVIATSSITTQPIVDREILIYYDDEYPSLGVSRAGWVGLLDHIPIELQLRNYQGAIKIVNAVGLKYEMQTNFDSIIIIPSGVFPATVHAANQSLVGDWIRAGGTLIWVGDAFAHFSGYSGGVISHFSAESLASSQNQTLGFVLFNETLTGNQGYTPVASNFSNALDLRYPLASTGAYVSQILNSGGIVLGKITASENARTAIASLPISMGRLILFGGGIRTAFTATGEDVIAHDIAQILCSGVLFSSGRITYNFHELNKDEIGNGTIIVSTPISGQVGIIVVAFSESPYVYYFSRNFYVVDIG